MSDLFAAKVAAFTARMQADLGIHGFQADGVFGNIGHECAGFAAMHEIGKAAGEGGIGWMMWTGPRRKNFEAWCTAHLGKDGKPLSVTDDEANYSFLIHETTTDEKGALDALRQARTRDDATKVWMDKNERPAVATENLASRSAWALRADAARAAQEAIDLAKAKAAVAKNLAPTGAQPEGKAHMDDTSNVTAEAVLNSAAAPVATAVTTQAVASSALADEIRPIEAMLVDFLAAQLVAHGVPSLFVTMGKSMLEKVDVAEIIADAVRQIDPEKVALAVVSVAKKRVAA